VKKDIRKMSYKKRVTNKIRSAGGPLRMGRRELAKNGVKWTRFGKIFEFGFLRRKFREGEYT
jgi:hypothetical protein